MKKLYVIDEEHLHFIAHYDPPYEGAKDILFVEDLDYRFFLAVLFVAMESELKK